jgi:F-type H+-transporting ATPase subunit b
MDCHAPKRSLAMTITEHIMLPQAEISTYFPQIFWLAIAFGFLYFVILKFIAPKIEQVLVTRQKNIDDDLGSAHLLTEEISSLKDAYESALAKIYEEVDNIMQTRINNLNSAYEDKNSALQKELHALKITSLDKIKEDIISFRDSSQKHAIDLAKFIIEKMINKEPNIEILTQSYKNNADIK